MEQHKEVPAVYSPKHLFADLASVPSRYLRRLTVAPRLIIVAAAFCGPIVHSQPQFEDVSDQVGMMGNTETWGLSWGDINGDNWPDAFLQGHRNYPRVYRNTGEGNFEEIAFEIDPGVWIADPFSDQHGLSFGDFDNDGDEDILMAVSVAGTGNGLLLVNDNNTGFDERGVEADLAHDSAARMTMWLDFTHDGYLDVIQFGLGGGNYIRYQDPAQGLDFDDQSQSAAAFDCDNSNNTHGQLIDANNDGSLDLLCVQRGTFPNVLHDISSIPFQNITSLLPTIGNVNETIIGDFNNDLLNDIVLVRGATRPPDAALVNNRRIEAWLTRQSSSPPGKGFGFVSNGSITVTVYNRDTGRYNPPYVMNLNFGSSQQCVSSGRHEVCAGFDGGDNRWEVVFGQDGRSTQAYIIVDAVEPISGLTNILFDTRDDPIDPRLLLQQSGGGFSYDFGWGLTQPISCGGGTAGDFDNDMDVDLYLVCRNGPINLANRFYRNNGNGTFTLIQNSGAEGPVGVDIKTIGVADNAAAADYDVDGFLDILVVNGLLYYPVGVGAPDTLLHNLGNSNHWLELDLHGTVSNSSAIGAKVYVTAGGVEQLREQNGGYHRFSQDHQRVHFGLASNQTANIVVQWPSGLTDVFNNVAADSLYDVVEGQSISQAILGPPVHTTLAAGDECGEPPYDLEYGPAVFLWRDCPGDNWHLRAKGGREDEEVLFTGGAIVADAAFGGVSGSQLTGGDNLNNAVPEVIQYNVGVWFTANKGFNFNTSGQTTSCFSVTNRDIPGFFVGASGKRVPTSFDLVTLADCAAPPPPPPPPDDPECGDPLYDRTSEPGLFAWRDCGFGGPGARWNVHAVAGGLPWSEYAGSIVGDTILSATGFSLATPDVVDSQSGDEVIDFSLFLGGSGIDGFQIDVPLGAAACFESTQRPGGTQVMIGADRQVMNGAFDLLTLQPCAPPPEPPECGAPSYSNQTDPGVFVWRDCNAPGPGQAWEVRISGGGLPWFRYQGSAASNMALGVTAVSVESNDTLDSDPDVTVVDFNLGVGGAGSDGFRLDVAAGAQTCLNVSALPGGVEIQLGADRLPKGSQLDLVTLGACN